MDIFSTSIRGLLKDHPNKTVAINKKGRIEILGPFKSKLLSSISPAVRERVEKLLGYITKEELPLLIASHKVSSPVEQAIIDDNVSCFKEDGKMSNEIPREILREIVIHAMDRLENQSHK